MKIVEGPITIGNIFGFYGCTVPAGYFAIVTDGTYNNGGRGPSTVNGIMYKFRSRAERVMSELQSKENVE